MYQFVSGKEHTWGLEFYEVNKIYEDPIKLREMRLKQGNPPSKRKLYITNKGHYLSDMAKQNKTPGPGTYPLPEAWTARSLQKKLGVS
jgi:hypothetical protein